MKSEFPRLRLPTPILAPAILMTPAFPVFANRLEKLEKQCGEIRAERGELRKLQRHRSAMKLGFWTSSNRSQGLVYERCRAVQQTRFRFCSIHCLDKNGLSILRQLHSRHEFFKRLWPLGVNRHDAARF